MQDLIDRIVALEKENEKLKKENDHLKFKYESKADPALVAIIIDHLNKRTNRSYRAANLTTRKLIGARLAEGYTVEDMKAVIDNQCAKWLNDEEMEQYLRPITLFNASKFEGYLNNARRKREVNIREIINARRSI